MIIKAIVYAENKEDALGKARTVFEGLTREGRTFDYYQMFDKSSGNFSGDGRWGEMSNCVLASSKEGREFIGEGMRWTYEEFKEHLEEVKAAINAYPAHVLFEERCKSAKSGSDEKLDLSLFRFKCYKLGQYSGDAIYLYDGEGSGIRSFRHLKDVLSKYADSYEKRGKKNPYENLLVWVVPADVHY